MKSAFVFPGQGSQFVGMGRDLFENFAVAKEVFTQVDDVLGRGLSRIIFEGTEEELRDTRNAQPALMAVSMAVLRVIEAESGKALPDLCNMVAGHSLGEYSALCAAGSLSLRETAFILEKRGQFMAEAGSGKGAMLAVLGLELVDVEGIVDSARQGEVLVVANDNSPGQVVLSGEVQAIKRAAAIAKEKGAKMAVELPVSGAFHSPLIKAAEDLLAQELFKLKYKEPSVPVYSNVTASVFQDVSEVPMLLARQVVSPVRWREIVLAMESAGVTKLFEIGAKNVLCGLAKRTTKVIEPVAIGDVASVRAFLATLKL